MALSQSALLEVLDALNASDSTDVIRKALQVMLQQLIDAEATAFIGAEPHERTQERTTQRNGTRSKTITTTAGDVDLSITKLRQGSFFPSLLERRRRIDQALFAVIMEAYVSGTSVRKVDNLVKPLGADTGISKSEVSRICADLDEEVAGFADRSLGEQSFPYLDATYCKARVGGARNGKGSRVVSQAVVIATGVTADGRREVLGFGVGDSEDGAFWTAFLRSLKARGLSGTKLVISDAHAGLKAAISAVMIGATWQRCRVHFLRNVLGVVPKGSAEMVAAAIRTIFTARSIRGSARPSASQPQVVRKRVGVLWCRARPGHDTRAATRSTRHDAPPHHPPDPSPRPPPRRHPRGAERRSAPRPLPVGHRRRLEAPRVIGVARRPPPDPPVPRQEPGDRHVRGLRSWRRVRRARPGRAVRATTGCRCARARPDRRLQPRPPGPGDRRQPPPRRASCR